MEMSLILVVVFIFLGQIIGATIGLLGKPRNSVLYGSLAFAAAMMISLSLFELIPEALQLSSKPIVMLSFFAGIVFLLAIDKILPHINPEFMHSENPSVRRSVFMLVIGIALHNIPEGLAIGVSFQNSEQSGLLIALGIALQDIPENIATIIPLYAFTRSRLKAFAITTSTVLFEFIGFLIGFIFFKNSANIVLSMSLAAAAGFMTYISVEELMPEAFEYQSKKPAWTGFVIGTAIVLIMLSLF